MKKHAVWQHVLEMLTDQPVSVRSLYTQSICSRQSILYALRRMHEEGLCVLDYQVPRVGYEGSRSTAYITPVGAVWRDADGSLAKRLPTRSSASGCKVKPAPKHLANVATQFDRVSQFLTQSWHSAGWAA